MRINTFLLTLFTFCLSADDVRKDVWETTDLVWNFGLIQQCDVGMEKTPIHYFASEATFDETDYQNIKEGDLVWVKCLFIPQFCRQVLPFLTHPFVLVISDGDETFPSDLKEDQLIEDLLDNNKVIHVFAQNCAYKGQSSKVSPIPIGLDFHTVAYKGITGGWGERGTPKEQEALLKTISSEFLPTGMRKLRAFVDFQLSDTTHASYKRYLEYGEDRASIFKKLLETGLIDYSGFMRRSELWRTKGQYAFSISPHGNGLDCHRTWEDLSLGCIVIVKTSPLDPLYEGLPVVIIKDWSEITPQNLEKWILIYGDIFSTSEYKEKLTNKYWLNLMKNYSNNYKETR